MRRSRLHTAATPGSLRPLLVTLVILSPAWGAVPALARLTPDRNRRMELVDMVNAIGPRTWT